MFEFQNQNLLWLFLLFIPMFYWKFKKRKKNTQINFSRVDILKKIVPKYSIVKYLPFLLRLLCLSFLIFALARPTQVFQKKDITGEGIDIILALDNSGSMQAVDFKPQNRLAAIKEVAKEFINNRLRDRISIVSFADNAFTLSPLTLDYKVLNQILDNLQIDQDSKGTAIGLGLATAVARLSESTAKSKVVILLTDGRNNSGEIDPVYVANLAKTKEIKVYAIGAGKEGLVDFPARDVFNNIVYQKVNIPIDMESLNSIAQITGTEYARRAQNTQELQNIFKEIDKLEKTKYKIKNYFEYKEKFPIFLWLAFFCLLIELLFNIPFKIFLP